MRARRSTHALAAALIAGATSSACASGNSAVTRMVRGQELPGRYIGYEAYAAYASGVYLESHGDLRGAAAAYRRAADEDAKSPEIWTRLAALRCQLGAADAALLFERARRLDPNFEPLYRTRARCALKSGDQRRALEDALHALRLDPDQEETSLLLVRLYDESGRARDAARYLDAWVARAPASTPALRTLLAFAIRHGDRLRRERAEVGLQVMRRSPARVPGAQIPVYDALDGAIARGELSRARTLADDALLSPGALAVRAAALGFTDFAETQAEFVQAANPRDSDAWASTLLCADLLHDEPGFAQALLSRDLQLGSEPRVPAFDALTVRLLAELLDRRVGRDAARNWLRAYGRLPAARDPLERALDERIATFLAP